MNKLLTLYIVGKSGIKWGKWVFRGSSLATLDNKGRLSVPSRYREVLQQYCAGQLICTIDLYYPCLLLYPLPEWEKIEKKLSTLSSLDLSQRRIQRLLLGHATEYQMDNAGRILISSGLRSHANINKTVVLVGQLNKFELWDEANWDQQIAQDLDEKETNTALLTERLQDLSY